MLCLAGAVQPLHVCQAQHRAAQNAPGRQGSLPASTCAGRRAAWRRCAAGWTPCRQPALSSSRHGCRPCGRPPVWPSSCTRQLPVRRAARLCRAAWTPRQLRELPRALPPGWLHPSPCTARSSAAPPHPATSMTPGCTGSVCLQAGEGPAAAHGRSAGRPVRPRGGAQSSVRCRGPRGPRRAAGGAPAAVAASLVHWRRLRHAFRCARSPAVGCTSHAESPLGRPGWCTRIGSLCLACASAAAETQACAYPLAR